MSGVSRKRRKSDILPRADIINYLGGNNYGIQKIPAH
jgi:hypothetical protein